jgi:uncharacterized integral membrane protein
MTTEREHTEREYAEDWWKQKVTMQAVRDETRRSQGHRMTWALGFFVLVFVAGLLLMVGAGIARVVRDWRNR